LKWIFWFAAIVALLLGILAFVGIPTDTDSNRFAPDGTLKIETSKGEIHERKPKMDYPGTFLQTAAIVLFICQSKLLPPESSSRTHADGSV
jgi:hypothetical protein